MGTWRGGALLSILLGEENNPLKLRFYNESAGFIVKRHTYSVSLCENCVRTLLELCEN